MVVTQGQSMILRYRVNIVKHVSKALLAYLVLVSVQRVEGNASLFANLLGETFRYLSYLSLHTNLQLGIGYARPVQDINTRGA